MKEISAQDRNNKDDPDVIASGSGNWGMFFPKGWTGRMYDIRPTDPQELMRRVIFCQQHEKAEEELITAEGLRVKPVPPIKEHKLDWTPSGLKNPNAWRNK